MDAAINSISTNEIKRLGLEHLPILNQEECKYFNPQDLNELSDIAIVTSKGREKEIYVKGLTYRLNCQGQELSLVYKNKESKMIFPNITFAKYFDTYTSKN